MNNWAGKHFRAGCLFKRAMFFVPFAIALGLVAAPSQAQQTNVLGTVLQQQLQNNTTGQGFGPNGLNMLGNNSGAQPDMMAETYSPSRSAAIATSRLEQIISARAGLNLSQFGYQQFGSGSNVTIPQTGAVQDDYVLGPGDQVIVSLRGQENSEFRAAIDRNGQILLPRLRPISAIGRTFGDVRRDLESSVHRAYVATDAFISVATIRQISVLVSGEVNNPGQRTLSGLSSVVDAILLSSGVKKSGTLRNVKIQRGDRQFIVDLYSVLTGGGSASSLRLADGDRIIVPPLGPVIAVSGLVRRPGIYELPARASGMTARALLNLAGGQEVRGRYRLAVQRIEADGRLHLVTLQSDSGIVRDSEILRVELGADFADTQATLSGGIGSAGQYPVMAGTRLSDVIKAPGALGLSPYTLFGILVRKDPRTLLRSLVAFTPVAVLNGKEDLPLVADDVIRPITVDESKLLTFVVQTYLDKLALDQARIRSPLDASSVDATSTQSPVNNSSNNNNAGASSVTSNAGAFSPDNPFGLQPGALQAYSWGQEDFSGVSAEGQRRNVTALLNVAAPGTLLSQQRNLAYQQALLTANSSTPNQTPIQALQAQQAAMLASETGTPLQTNGVVGQRNGTNGADSTNSTNTAKDADAQSGVANAQFPENYQDQTTIRGAYASNREVHTFGELSRQLGIDPLVLVNFLLDHRTRLDGSVRGPGVYFIGPNVSLDDLVQAAGGTVSWADENGVELLSTAVDSRNGRSASKRQTLPLHQATLASYVVRPRDQLHFNQVFTDVGIGSVTVQGEVRFGGSYPILRGDHLSDLLMRAGGLTSTAYPAGTVFLRKSAAQVEEQGYKRSASEIQSQLLAGMARVGNDKITGEGFTAIQGFINQLRVQKGLGRIAIAADPSVLAANPQQDPLLEAGDVLFIPQRPSTVTVLGEVMQPGTYTYRSGLTVADYIKKAGGYAQYSDDDLTFIVQANGEARRLEKSWLGFDASKLAPGSSIVVPRDLAPLTARQVVLDMTGIMSSLAVTIASLAILAKQ